MSAPQDFSAWKAARLAALTAEDGWLNLTDRIAIGEDWQNLGSGPGNDLILSRGPGYIGRLRLTATGAELETPDFRHDFTATTGNPMLRLAPFLLELHTVAGETALRVRDLTMPREVGLNYFRYDPAWNIMAEWEALRVPVAQIVGQKGAGAEVVSLTHRAHFQRDSRKITLLATHWKGALPMFVIRDATSGAETYAAARFLIGLPDGDRIRLDFNRAHNPPCAFTDFAICPLPLRDNILPFRIAAGERRLPPELERQFAKS